MKVRWKLTQLIYRPGRASVEQYAGRISPGKLIQETVKEGPLDCDNPRQAALKKAFEHLKEEFDASFWKIRTYKDWTEVFKWQSVIHILVDHKSGFSQCAFKLYLDII